MPSNLGHMGRQDTSWVDEGQEEALNGELNSKRLEELYAKSGIKDRDRSIEEELKKWEHQSSFDFPIQMTKEVKAYIIYFSTERKGFTRRSLSRSSRYLPMIKETFREYGLPEDLAYLAMVESGFNPQAASPAGACGMWQFIKGTGLRYGLVINSNIDERQDPEKSTRAAAQYLLDLYKQFGSWYLAAASYNCGEKRVQKELTKSNYSNFWELSANKCIPGETRNYVPQMIAATIIARNPQKFGFSNVPYQSPLTPHTAPGFGLARAESPPKPVRPAKPIKLANLAAAPSVEPDTPKAVTPKPKSPDPAKGLNQKTQRRVYANNGKTTDKHATQARSSPYMASLFGHPHAPAKNTQAAKKKATPDSHKTGINRQKSKPSPALFAKKNKTKPGLLAKKSKAKPPSLAEKRRAQKPKLSKSRSKPKSKALFVSQAR